MSVVHIVVVSRQDVVVQIKPRNAVIFDISSSYQALGGYRAFRRNKASEKNRGTLDEQPCSEGIVANDDRGRCIMANDDHTVGAL